MYLFKLVFLFSSAIYSETELWNHRVVLFSVFWGNSILFSIVAVPIYISTSSVLGFPFLHIRTTFVICCLPAKSHPDRCEVTFHLGSICISSRLVTLSSCPVFMCLFAICVSSLEKCLLILLPMCWLGCFVFDIELCKPFIYFGY